ncbi:putative conjugative transposon protein [Streptococcus pneumoniae]|nr:putative conjugative transposon protein [Streptococcus pneumoniae]
MFLFDEPPIFVNPILARDIGLDEALVLQQLNYWTEVNRKTGKNYHEGRYWIYNSIRGWKEENFDYMSLDTVKRIFPRLEKAGYLLTGNFNEDTRDKTKWYATNDEQLEALFWQLFEEKNQRKSKIRG